MLRVVDVAAALSLRGYSPGVTGEVHFDVTADEVLPENAGRWVLRVSIISAALSQADIDRLADAIAAAWRAVRGRQESPHSIVRVQP